MNIPGKVAQQPRPGIQFIPENKWDSRFFASAKLRRDGCAKTSAVPQAKPGAGMSVLVIVH